MDLASWAYFYSVGHVSVFLAVPCCFGQYSFMFKSGIKIPPGLFFVLRVVLGYPKSLGCIQILRLFCPFLSDNENIKSVDCYCLSGHFYNVISVTPSVWRGLPLFYVFRGYSQ